MLKSTAYIDLALEQRERLLIALKTVFDNLLFTVSHITREFPTLIALILPVASSTARCTSANVPFPRLTTGYQPSATGY